MHSSLAVTPQGLPLGLAAIQFWSRKEFKDTATKRHKVNFTYIPIEQKQSFRWIENLRQSTGRLGDPDRCVHFGDRESDIFELFCAASELGTHFLVRTCPNRLAGDGGHTVAAEMSEVRVKGLHRIEFRDAKGCPHQARLEIRYRRLTVWPPVAKQRHYPALRLTVIHATEPGEPVGRPPIEWKLLTDLPVNSRADAIEKIDWYAMRWKTETFHKNLKSGCKAEESQLRTASRLTNLIAIFCILAWRVFWLTEINRSAPQAPPEEALTATEVTLLDQLVRDTARTAQAPPLSRSLIKLAQLGGYTDDVTSARGGWCRRRSSTAGRTLRRTALQVVVDDIRPDKIVGTQGLEDKAEFATGIDAAASDGLLALRHALFVNEHTEIPRVAEIEHGRGQREPCHRLVAARSTASADDNILSPTHQRTALTLSAPLIARAISIALIAPFSG
jgi:hypothetical protein